MAKGDAGYLLIDKDVARAINSLKAGFSLDL
jgi:hypothetical protein